MATQLRWIPHFTVSCLHAAEAAAYGREIVDARLAEAIERPAAALQAEITASELPSARFWRQLIPLATTFPASRDVVKLALVRSIGGGERVTMLRDKLAGLIDDVKAAVQEAFPQMMEELELRVGPLRSQWEARGPGMLRIIGELTEERLLVPGADVILVHPALGGGGDAHLPNNTVRIEAVLANQNPELPEVVRLAWMISQLHLDVPLYGENVHIDRLPHVARFAMLLPALQAAEEVELVQLGPDLVQRAISAWNLEVPPDVDAADLVIRWWATYRDSRPPFNIALEALDQMLH